jgi:hypothetical protein
MITGSLVALDLIRLLLLLRGMGFPPRIISENYTTAAGFL